jgi:hypothetical protein
MGSMSVAGLSVGTRRYALLGFGVPLDDDVLVPGPLPGR